MNGRHSENEMAPARIRTIRPDAVGRDTYWSDRPATSIVPWLVLDAGIPASTAAATIRLTRRARPVPTRYT